MTAAKSFPYAMWVYTGDTRQKNPEKRHKKSKSGSARFLGTGMQGLVG
jgi:hypothetical protein